MCGAQHSWLPIATNTFKLRYLCIPYLYSSNTPVPGNSYLFRIYQQTFLREEWSYKDGRVIMAAVGLGSTSWYTDCTRWGIAPARVYGRQTGVSSTLWLYPVDHIILPKRAPESAIFSSTNFIVVSHHAC